MKTKILFNTLLALGAGLAAVLAPVTAHAHNLYVTVVQPGEIFEYTPSGVQSTYATGLSAPRGLAFDSIGNLFAAETVFVDHIQIGRVLKYNLHNKISTVGSAVQLFFEEVATDIAGNAYVMGVDDTGAGTIFKFTPSGERIVFGSVPTTPNPILQPFGLAFDSSGNLFVAESNDFPDGDILEFPPGGGSPTVFASFLNRPQFLTFGPPR